MRCPYCGELETKVVDSREIDSHVRRRRECGKCSKRFTTYEKVEKLGIIILKKNGDREPFDMEKIKRSLVKACSKRPVTVGNIEELTESIAFRIKSLKSTEVSSKKVGQYVLNGLKKLDKVSYLRFISVHKEFEDVKDFEEEIKNIKR